MYIQDRHFQNRTTTNPDISISNFTICTANTEVVLMVFERNRNDP